MTDSRLSVEMFVCSHRCCQQPDDQSHLHLFPPDDCPVCAAVVTQEEGRSPWKQ